MLAELSATADRVKTAGIGKEEALNCVREVYERDVK